MRGRRRKGKEGEGCVVCRRVNEEVEEDAEEEEVERKGRGGREGGSGGGTVEEEDEM